MNKDQANDKQTFWQPWLSTDTTFCRALVSSGYLSEEQMLRAADRYHLGLCLLGLHLLSEELIVKSEEFANAIHSKGEIVYSYDHFLLCAPKSTRQHECLQKPWRDVVPLYSHSRCSVLCLSDQADGSKKG